MLDTTACAAVSSAEKNREDYAYSPCFFFLFLSSTVGCRWQRRQVSLQRYQAERQRGSAMAEEGDDQSVQAGQQKEEEPKRDKLNLSDERVAEFKEAFAKYDTDDNGTVEASELGPIMRSLGYKPTETDLQACGELL
ncbi:hypothetical protein HPB48_007689 [Haemaphysalis longicornis]|uniref:EF-hand domain-containing protein n=1 Tax=Haemaphysalis longicornis TaxID=44386 RepID=A0A9J6G2M6_HAELO|nr:hypothetical protein HPB48_007689 [Haemaphysalis longicornis]